MLVASTPTICENLAAQNNFVGVDVSMYDYLDMYIHVDYVSLFSCPIGHVDERLFDVTAFQ